MTAPKSKEERFEVISVRIRGADLEEIRRRGISLGPLVRDLVAGLLAEPEAKD